MAMSAGGGGGVQSTPNVTPMVDVMLVLLIIFMVVTPALLAGFTADPPKLQNIKDHPEDDQVDQVLGIDKAGAYYLNKHPIKYEELAPTFHRIYIDTKRDDRILYFKADQATQFSKVLDAMDIAAKNGVRMVGMIAEQRGSTVSMVPGDVQAKASGFEKTGGK